MLGYLQLSGNPRTVGRIVKGDAAVVRRLRRQLLADYAFIVCYWGTFVWLSAAIARRGGAGYDLLGLLAALAATATALLDMVENVRTRGMLALTGPGDQVRLQPVQHLRRTSLWKWGASALTLAALALFFLPGEGWALVLGAALLVTAAVGFAGVWRTALIRPFLLGFFAIGLAIAVWFTFFPDSVLERL